MKINKSEAEWRNLLSEEQFDVCRNKGTEKPFSGEYAFFEKEGRYHCVCCGQRLFDSNVKFDAGCGWPSFYDVHDAESVILRKDSSLGMERVEVMCSGCEAHLGHVFPDGPQPTGLRYCINSVSMTFHHQGE